MTKSKESRNLVERAVLVLIMSSLIGMGLMAGVFAMIVLTGLGTNSEIDDVLQPYEEAQSALGIEGAWPGRPLQVRTCYGRWMFGVFVFFDPKDRTPLGITWNSGHGHEVVDLSSDLHEWRWTDEPSS